MTKPKKEKALNQDISPLLKNWDYEAGSVNARMITAEDGRACIQMRMDLGLFQMELTDRPDGTRPHGYATALDYYQIQAETSTRPFRLDADACGELQQEAVQFYHRYIARMQLKDFEGVVNDTRHNLDILALVERNTEDEDLSWDFIQFKPYTLMMHYRAEAEIHAANKEMNRATQSAKIGLSAIRNFWVLQGEEELQKDSYEINSLKDLIKAYEEDRSGASETDRLREALQNAVRLENFERAAVLRDRLRDLEKKPRRKSNPKPVSSKKSG